MTDDGTAPVRLLVLGAGGRGGHAYARWCLHHRSRAVVTGVADPRDDRCGPLADAHGVPERFRFRSWEEALAGPGPWDAVVIATPDRLHVDPALRALALGYDILLEKPIAPTAGELRRMTAGTDDLAASRVTVGHVLRYTPYFRTVKRVLDEGAIGELQTVQWAENIGYWHFAHSYVRGNWHATSRSSPMILAKASHDFDLLRWLIGRPTRRVSSFGSLTHFRPERAPAGSTPRCTDGCAVADTCPYNAVRFYVERLADVHGPPVSVMTTDTSPEGRMHALRTTDYGRCVYRMDNDVVDQQTVNLEFEGGLTASVLVTAFTPQVTRAFRLHGSEGELSGDLERGELTLTRWLDEEPVPVPIPRPGTGGDVGDVGVGEAFRGHAGGDAGLMDAFVDRVRRRLDGAPASDALTSLEESVESHLIAFAAEESRRTGAVVDLESLSRD